MELSNKVVLITGASSGIGAETAILFAEKSARLILVGRNVNNLQKTCDECERIGEHKPLVVVADVTNEDDVHRIYEETVNGYGKLDVLVNNAGASFPTGIIDGNLDLYDETLDLNLRAVYHLTTVFAPLLIENKGNIVNISSVASKLVRTGNVPYAVSKAGLDQMTKLTALELAPKGVRVNAVNPGVTVTNFFENSGLTKEEVDSYMSRICNHVPLGRPTEGKEVGNMILYLASNLASSVTGACFVIDGGLSLKGLLQPKE